IFVHQHLHMLDPHLPGVLGDVFVDLLPQRMALERHLVQPFQLFLEFHAEHLARSRTNRVADLIKSASAASTSHRCLLCPCYYCLKPAPMSTAPSSRASGGSVNVLSTSISTVAVEPLPRCGPASTVCAPGPSNVFDATSRPSSSSFTVRARALSEKYTDALSRSGDAGLRSTSTAERPIQ